MLGGLATCAAAWARRTPAAPGRSRVRAQMHCSLQVLSLDAEEHEDLLRRRRVQAPYVKAGRRIRGGGDAVMPAHQRSCLSLLGCQARELVNLMTEPSSRRTLGGGGL